MKKSLYILLIFFFCTILLKSQHLSPVWVKHLGGTSNDYFNQNLIDSDGNIIVVAEAIDTYIDTFYVNGRFFAKLTQDGHIFWLENFDTTYFNWTIFSKLNNHNDIITFSRTTHDYNNTIFELAKYNSLGEMEWGKNFTKANNPFNDMSKHVSLEICSDDYIHLALYIEAFYFVLPNGDTLSQSQLHKYYVFKFDPDGNLISTFEPSTNNRLEDFKIDNDNNSYHLTNIPYSSSLLIKYDNNYNFIQQVNILDFYAEKFFLDDSNNVFIPHVSSQSLFGYSNDNNIPKVHLYVAKYNENNALEWANKFYGHIDSFPHHILPHIPIALKTDFGNINMAENQNDVYVYGLFKYKFSIANNEYFSADSSKMSYFISKFDKQGNYHWTEIFNNYTDISISYFKTIDLKVLDDGTLLCGLWFDNYIEVGDSIYQSRGGWDILFMRLEETGVGIAPVAANDDLDFRVYPNPAKELIYIETDKAINADNYRIEIFNITGQKVLEEKFTHQLNCNKLQNGIYIMRISENNLQNRKVINKKLIISR